MKIVIFTTTSILLASICHAQKPQEEKPVSATSIVEIKPEYKLDPKQDTVGETMLYGGFFDQEKLGPNSISFSGNSRLIAILQKVELENVDKIVVNEKALTEVADMINEKLPATSKWKLKVSDDAKKLRASGVIDKNLVQSLTRLMHRENFYCRVTDGTVEFKKGVNELNLVPLEKLAIASVAEEPVKPEVKNVTQTFAKINAACDYDIKDAPALDLLKFVSQQQIPIDISEVEGILEAKRIRLTIKAERWIDIITHTADQIGASVLIGNGTIKLVANKEARLNQQEAEQPGPAQPATKPADKVPPKDQPSTPTSKPAPR